MNRWSIHVALAVLAAAPIGCRCGDAGRGYETFTRQRVRDSALAQRCNDRGLACVERGEWEEAEKAFRAALEADLFYPAAHNNLGLVLLQRQQACGAYSAAWEFQYAAKLLPRSVEPRNNLGLVFEHVGRLEDAEEQYRQALAIDPDNIEVMGHLARVYIKQQKPGEDLPDLLRELALRADGNDWQTWARQQLLKLAVPDARTE